MTSSLCSKVGVLQRKAAFARSATVSVVVQNIGGDISHPIEIVSSINTNSLYSPYKIMTIPILGASVGRKTMW